jgi:hypothetical protein
MEKQANVARFRNHSLVSRLSSAWHFHSQRFIRLPSGCTRAEKQRIETGIDAVGINVASSAQQDTIQCLAYVATVRTFRSYFHTLKQLEHGIPPLLHDEWKKLELEFDRPRVWLHQGVPLFPAAPIPVMLVALAILGPVTVAGWLLNLPPLVAGAWAGREFPNEANVVSMWRILVRVLATCFITGHAFLAALYRVFTFAALKLWRRTRNTAIEINTPLRHPGVRGRAFRFHKLLLNTLPNETH